MIGLWKSTNNLPSFLWKARVGNEIARQIVHHFDTTGKSNNKLVYYEGQSVCLLFFFYWNTLVKKKNLHLAGYLKPSCRIHCSSNFLQQQMAALHPIARWLTLMFVLDSVLWFNSWLQKVKCPFVYMKGWKMCMGMQQWMPALLDDVFVAVKKLKDKQGENVSALMA